MIIPFWSTHHGQSRVSCNMTSFAIMSVLLNKKTTLMMQADYDMNNLEGAFLGFTGNKFKTDILSEIGLGAVFKSFKSEPLTKSIVDDCCTTYLSNYLSLLPGCYSGNRDAFKRLMNELFPTVLKKLNTMYETILIDTPSGNNLIAKSLFTQSDLIVVCLNQNVGFIENFFNLYDFWKNKNTFYLIGDYDCNAVYNYRHILNKYPQIRFDNSAVIPYNTSFRDSLNDASTIEFFRFNYDVKNLDRYDKNYAFFLELEQAVHKVDKMLNKKRRKL